MNAFAAGKNGIFAFCEKEYLVSETVDGGWQVARVARAPPRIKNSPGRADARYRTRDGWQCANGGGVVELAGILIFEFIVAAVLVIVAMIAFVRIIRFMMSMIVAIIGVVVGAVAGRLRRSAERRRLRQAERLLWTQRRSGRVARIDPHFDPDFRRRSPE